MLGTFLQDRKKTTEDLRVYHPYTKDRISLNISDVVKTILSPTNEAEIPNTRYSLSLGDHLIQEAQFENKLPAYDHADYFLKIEKSIARAFSSLLQIHPPLELLKDFGVYFKNFTRLDNGKFVMNYVLEDDPLQSSTFQLTFLDSLAGLLLREPTSSPSESRLQSVFDANEILNTLMHITRGKSRSHLDRSVLSHKLDEIFAEMNTTIDDNPPIYEEVYYFANAIFYKIGADSHFWIQKFLKGLAETQNSSPEIYYLRRLFKDSDCIPLEEIPALLKGIFLLYAQNITPKLTSEGLKLHCKFSIGPHCCYVDVPRIEDGDLGILNKYLDPKDFSKILHLLHTDVSLIVSKYLATPDLSEEEFKWALTRADFKNKKVKFSQAESSHLVENIRRHSTTCFGPVLIEKIQELISRGFVEEPSKLFCGTLRRWIQAYPQQIHAISSDTWSFFESVAVSVSETDRKTQPWNLLLKDIGMVISELPNEGLANFMKKVKEKTDPKFDLGQCTQNLVCGPQHVKSPQYLCSLYKDLYGLPNIAQYIESFYLFPTNTLPEIYEKSDFSRALESRISYLIAKDHIDEVFLLLKHLYKLQKNQNTIVNHLQILFQRHMHNEDKRLQIISSALNGFPNLLGGVLNSLRGIPLAERLWINTLSHQGTQIPFEERISCLARFLDTNEIDPGQDLIVIQGLFQGVTQKDKILLLEECIARVSKMPNARIEAVVRHLLEDLSDLETAYRGKRLAAQWLQRFFTLLHATNMITEDRMQFLCTHIQNIPLLDIQPLVLSIVPHCKGNSKQILCRYFDNQFTLFKQSIDPLFEFWALLLQDPIFSTFSQSVEMRHIYRECFLLIVDKLNMFILQKKTLGVAQLKKYIPVASIEEKSLFAQTCIKQLPYQREVALDFLSLVIPFKDDLRTRSLQQFVPFWKESTWEDLDWFKGIHLFQEDPDCLKDFIEFMITHMKGYPIEVLKQVRPFLTEDIQALLKQKVQKEIAYLKYEAAIDQDKYISKLEQFLVFIMTPDFSFLSEDIEMYEDICEMSWTLLRQLKYDDRFNQFFKACFDFCLKERLIPAEKQDQVDLVRIGAAVDCAADLKLSKAKISRLISTLCSCSDSVLWEISNESLTKMKFKSSMLVLKALEEKCKECINLDKPLDPILLEKISEHLKDMTKEEDFGTEGLTKQQFREWAPLFQSLSQILMHFRFHPSQHVSLCAGNLALIFIRNEPLKTNLPIANSLVRDILQFRLYWGANVLGFETEKMPSEVETALQSFEELPHLNTIKDLQMYFDFWKEVYTGVQSQQIEQFLKNPSGLCISDLEIKRSLIRSWIDHYGTLDPDLKEQTDLVSKITDALEDICMFDEWDSQRVPLGILGADLLLDTKKIPESARKLELFLPYLLEMSTSTESYWVILELYQRFINKWAYDASGDALLGDKIQAIFKAFIQKASLECIRIQSIRTPEEYKLLYNNLLLMSATYLHHAITRPERESMEYIINETINKLIKYDIRSPVYLINKIRDLINYEKQDLDLQNRYKDMCRMFLASVPGVEEGLTT